MVGKIIQGSRRHRHYMTKGQVRTGQIILICLALFFVYSLAQFIAINEIKRVQQQEETARS